MPSNVDEEYKGFVSQVDKRMRDEEFTKANQLIIEDVIKRGRFGGLGAQQFVDEEKRQLNKTLEIFVAAFRDVLEIHLGDKKDLEPFIAQVLKRYGVAAEWIRKSRDVGIRAAHDTPEHFTNADVSEKIRNDLEGGLRLEAARVGAKLEREKAVQQRAFRTALAVSLCGVVVAAALSFGSAVYQRLGDRGYQAREKLRDAIVPHIEKASESGDTIRCGSAHGRLAFGKNLGDARKGLFDQLTFVHMSLAVATGEIVSRRKGG